jgi:hypothetical protein
LPGYIVKRPQPFEDVLDNALVGQFDLPIDGRPRLEYLLSQLQDILDAQV